MISEEWTPMSRIMDKSRQKTATNFNIAQNVLKGHGNEADFLGVLQKLVPHWYFTLPFEPFRFWLRIRRDIRNQKTTPRLAESAFECLKEILANRRVGDSPTRRVGESLWWVGESLFKFFYCHFKLLNQPFKRSIWQKRTQGFNVLSPLIYLKVWKNCIYTQTWPTPRLNESGSRFSIPKIRS